MSPESTICLPADIHGMHGSGKGLQSVPSSFSRPLEFKDIYKTCYKIDLKISMLENEYEKYDEVLAIKEAQERINDMERKNMQQMGLFVTLTTFLVGLLSIFIGNNGQVSIIEKMRYVIALGLILLIFACVGFFAMNDKQSKCKKVLFGILIILFAASILGICWTSGENKHDESDTTESNTNKQDSVFGEPQSVAK